MMYKNKKGKKKQYMCVAKVFDATQDLAQG